MNTLIKGDFMNRALRFFLIGLTMVLVSGCANVFKKPGDQPVKSPCESVCKKPPFYVNGKRMKV
jgi:hypothetical protein